jgi:predicted RNA binding protein YcfA (HicA-like mRNA interferase family)
VPRLKCTFREFIDIIRRNGFVLHREGKGSHAIWRRQAGSAVYLVTVAAHNLGDEILPATLNAMIRQSGLSKELFRK